MWSLALRIPIPVEAIALPAAGKSQMVRKICRLLDSASAPSDINLQPRTHRRQKELGMQSSYKFRGVPVPIGW
jgi:hypothetical protein